MIRRFPRRTNRLSINSSSRSIGRAPSRFESLVYNPQNLGSVRYLTELAIGSSTLDQIFDNSAMWQAAFPEPFEGSRPASLSREYRLNTWAWPPGDGPARFFGLNATSSRPGPVPVPRPAWHRAVFGRKSSRSSRLSADRAPRAEGDHVVRFQASGLCTLATAVRSDRTAQRCVGAAARRGSARPCRAGRGAGADAGLITRRELQLQARGRLVRHRLQWCGMPQGPPGPWQGDEPGWARGPLREHYTNSRESAASLAAYLRGQPAGKPQMAPATPERAERPAAAPRPAPRREPRSRRSPARRRGRHSPGSPKPPRRALREKHRRFRRATSCARTRPRRA